MFKKVILPVCGKENCRRARLALQRVKDICDGEFVLLHITESVPNTVGGEAREELERQHNANGLAALAPMIALLEAEGLPFHSRVVEGTVPETIVRIADEENADLIAMVTDGRDNLGDLIMGSITERVLHNTGVDLLAVQPKPAGGEQG